jgi:hypothetical protein
MSSEMCSGKVAEYDARIAPKVEAVRHRTIAMFVPRSAGLEA